jgi:glycosyltransferase involved in cell wall biosynthesis
VLAGLLLKRWTGLPLISDFRDAWLLDPLDPLGTIGGAFEAPLSAAREALLRRLEAQVVNGSDHLLFTSETTRDAYERTYPGVGARSTLLYNGVEESDFLPAADRSCPFALTYVGTLHPFQSGQAAVLVKAYGIALSLEPGFAASQLRLFGHRPAMLDALVTETARAAGAAAHLRLGGVIPHREAVSLVKSRGLVLVLAGESAFTRPSKISEALAAGRPILALAADASETARSVRPFGHLVYSGADPDELARLILAVWARHRADPEGAPPFPFPVPHPLNWRTACRGLAQILSKSSSA